MSENDGLYDDNSSSNSDSTKVRHMADDSNDDEETERRARRERLLEALELIMSAPVSSHRQPQQLAPLPSPPPLQQLPPLSAPSPPASAPPVTVTVSRNTGTNWREFAFNVASMLVLFAAIALYISPELFIHASGVITTPLTEPQKSAFHPEWPLHTFDTVPRERAAILKAVVSDTRLYDQVIETLSYHLLQSGKRVLCMWHLRLPLSQRVSNVCVWKRRRDQTSVFSLRLVTPTVDEALFLPMYNLDIKGLFCLVLFLLLLMPAHLQVMQPTRQRRSRKRRSCAAGRVWWHANGVRPLTLRLKQ